VPLPHHPSPETIAAWPTFTPEAPLRLLVSGCLAGWPCGVDGRSYGDYPLAAHLLALPNVRGIGRCPEEAAFGTPRATPNLHGGTGEDALDGRARVLADTDEGEDLTDGMVREARRMAELGVQERVHLALLMDVSGACGSTVIYDGRRSELRFRRGAGVAGAAILRAQIPVVSQRDERTLRLVLQKLGGLDGAPLTDGLDHHERDWFRQYFSVP